MKYEPLNKNNYYIDKTEKLKKALEHFPCIYLEGAAASGKTTAVHMLIDKMLETSKIAVVVFDMKQEKKDGTAFLDKLCALENYDESANKWVILENLHAVTDKVILSKIAEFLQLLENAYRCICISREQVPEVFLELLWNGRMELVTMADLMFSEEDIEMLIEDADSPLLPSELYAVTGGWAGCVQMMIRFSLKNTENPWCNPNPSVSAHKLRRSYEIDTYIKNMILSSISTEEEELICRSEICPWVNAALLSDVWGMERAQDILDKLTRKGLLVFDERKFCWKIAPLIRMQEITDADIALQSHDKYTSDIGKSLANWYEKNGHIKEALEFYKKCGDDEAHKNCMRRHYKQIPYHGISYEIVMEWKENIPEFIYLRGMHCYEKKDFIGLEKEISRLSGYEMIFEQNQDFDKIVCTQEILLNLYYVKPDFSLDEWLEMLKNFHEKVNQKFHLYFIRGNAPTYLCGLRDLTELFACAKKEENRKARIWKDCLGEKEWFSYRMARMDYYLETERKSMITPEDIECLKSCEDVSALYLLIKMQGQQMDEDIHIQIEMLEKKLIQDENPIIVQTVKALINIYLSWKRRPEKLIRWIRSLGNGKIEITEDNYILYGYLAKGYLLLHQYEKGKKILEPLIQYEKLYRRGFMLAEHLYQQAIINWEENHHGHALQNVIESFLIGSQMRYVSFYASYGKIGIEVLESYIQWMQANASEGWRRKKKYQYGNVLRMPEADYLRVILRCAKRLVRINQPLQDEFRGERLTMMETVILQDISRGLTNSEICQDLNLKLPTIKTHIYSLYKKLGVGTRVQAIIKGKELGLLD